MLFKAILLEIDGTAVNLDRKAEGRLGITIDLKQQLCYEQAVDEENAIEVAEDIIEHVTSRPAHRLMTGSELYDFARLIERVAGV